MGSFKEDSSPDIRVLLKLFRRCCQVVESIRTLLLLIIQNRVEHWLLSSAVSAAYGVAENLFFVLFSSSERTQNL